jgi:hypothetical protein
LQVHLSSTRNGIYDVELVARAEDDRALGRRPCAQFGNLSGGIAFSHASDDFERALVDEYPFVVGEIFDRRGGDCTPGSNDGETE